LAGTTIKRAASQGAKSGEKEPECVWGKVQALDLIASSMA